MIRVLRRVLTLAITLTAFSLLIWGSHYVLVGVIVDSTNPFGVEDAGTFWIIGWPIILFVFGCVLLLALVLAGRLGRAWKALLALLGIDIVLWLPGLAVFGHYVSNDAGYIALVALVVGFDGASAVLAVVYLLRGGPYTIAGR